MVSAHHPAFQQCGDAVNAWHRFMSGCVGPKMNRATVSISGIVKFSVGGRSITVNNRTRTNRLLDKKEQVFIVAIRNLLNPNSPEPFGLKHFDGNDNKRLCGLALATDRRNWRFPIGEGEEGLIDFHFSVQQFPARSNHGASQPVQHCPGSFVASQPKHTLQPQCADSVLLVGDVPNGCKPDTKLSARLVENSPRRYCGLMSACWTN